MSSHPDKDELIFFGGEFFNGKKTYLYNDLFFYNIKKDTWVMSDIPNPPPRRCAHQFLRQGAAVGVWGEFYHYKDLWVLHLSTNTWEQIKVPGAPSGRSGHRMVLSKRQFPQKCQSTSINDMHAFSLDFTLSRLFPSGTGPSPRSACQITSAPDGSGVSIYEAKKVVEKGTIHSDMFLLDKDGIEEQVPRAPSLPPRPGFSLAVGPMRRTLLFGWVYEEEENETLEGYFYNDLYQYDINKKRWFPAQLKVEEESEEKEEGEGASDILVEPCARSSGMATVKYEKLYLYGGVFEVGDRQFTLNYLYCLDLHKMDQWEVLDPKTQVWLDNWSDSEDDEEDNEEAKEGDDEEEESEEESDEEDEEEHPPVQPGEALEDFQSRTEQYWVGLARVNMGTEAKDKKMQKVDIAIAKVFYEDQQ
ncbi:hypothetical protein J4Q44_G00094580 [Coregonus suidteri]|uniref:Kelch domain-containing protein 4 n=1 Tax=Coregonus suidteri TaxID=861788 RepID=A0AAN8M8Z8_9TELE